MGYYTNPDLGPEPCIFTSTIPAWNCLNLARLASKTTSSLIFVHLRATTEGNLSEQNCHPFQYGPLMFMHNGGIGGFKFIKRKLSDSLGDQWFVHVQGSTDSEWAFAMFLDSLEKLGVSTDDIAASASRPEGLGHVLLRKAVLMTISRINELTKQVPQDQDRRSLLNFAVTDGHSVVCSRYVSSRDDEAASLFFSSGTSWKRDDESKIGDYRMERKDKGGDIVLVASEPLTFERGRYSFCFSVIYISLLSPHYVNLLNSNSFIYSTDNWVTVPTNSTLTIHKQTVMIHPIIDEFYSHSPNATRSANFARTKGQSSGTPIQTPRVVPRLVSTSSSE